MKSLIQAFIRALRVVRRGATQHRLVLLAMLIILGALIAPHGGVAETGDEYIEPPAKVILKSAELGSSGVMVTWLESQPGAAKIAGYDIFRSRDNAPRSDIGHVESGTTAYLDADGQLGDVYTIEAFDDQTPALTSESSDRLVAVAERSGAIVMGDPDVTPDGSGQTTGMTSGKLVTDPDAEAALAESTSPEEVEQHIVDLTKQLGAAVDKGQDLAAHGTLNDLYENQKQLLRQYPKMSPEQRRSAAATCTTQEPTLEAEVHSLSEKDFFNGLLAMAGCDALETLGQ